MSKIIACPHCNGEITIETPKKAASVSTGTRGMLQGIALVDMTIEQLRREKINAKSVLYKATQRNAAPELLAANAVRVEAVSAELAKRMPPVAIIVTEDTEVANTEVANTEVAEVLSTDESVEALTELVAEN